MSESFAIPLSSFMKTENHLRKKRLGNSPSRDTMNFGLTNQVQSLERTDSKQTRFDLNFNTNKKNTKNNTNTKQSNYES